MSSTLRFSWNRLKLVSGSYQKNKRAVRGARCAHVRPKIDEAARQSATHGDVDCACYTQPKKSPICIVANVFGGKKKQNKNTADKQVFPDAEFLGWYTVAKQPSADDVHMYKQLVDANENPLLLMLDAQAASSPTQKELPVTIYESELRVVNDAPRVLFSIVPYVIETNEAERIAVDHVAHLSTAGGAGEGSQSLAHLASLRNAVHMLRQRLAMLERFVERQCQRAAANESLDLIALRQINALEHSLPSKSTSGFADELFSSFNDGALLSYLGAITKTIESANSLCDTFNAAHQASSSQRPRR